MTRIGAIKDGNEHQYSMMSKGPISHRGYTSKMLSSSTAHGLSEDVGQLTQPMSMLYSPSIRPMAEGRSPNTSPQIRNGSPQSIQSTSSRTPPASRRPTQGCQYETGMAKARRRIPYSHGADSLADSPYQRTRSLGGAEKQKLTTDMTSLYSRLLPSADSEERRARFVTKLESLLCRRWPDAHIEVSVFGSSGNHLGTSDSDVDICITTDSKEIGRVCLIAELLAQNGFQRVVCVSSAKVPIVKAWDPELLVACDMNVNNPMALQNTELIRRYIEIDERVRPLAMIVKYWAKRRMLNDAALGGTLSSYTWICMVLNFLQTREPPILPSLQQNASLEPVLLNGVNVAFDQDFRAYEGFGSGNKSTLGELLFQFFLYFGHQLDFEHSVVSLRLGKIIPKVDKGWQMLQDNRLCVEEPFNTLRNLANTADDTSMRGIHQELRRAHDLIAQGKLSSCCEQYQASPEDYRPTETFVHPVARPIIPQAPAQLQPQPPRGTRSYRQNKHTTNRTQSSRRSSNPVRNPNYLHDLPFQMTPQELQLQAQHQQHLLHDQLFQQYQYLQAQEAELRLQLYKQNLRQRGLYSSQSQASEQSPVMRLPLSPNLFQNRYGSGSPFLNTMSPASGIVTNPSSPMLGTVAPDNRRYARRTSLATTSSAGSLRAQSQPARTVPMVITYGNLRTGHEQREGRNDLVNDHPVVTLQVQPGHLNRLPQAVATNSLYGPGRQPPEFMGYYVGQSPLLSPSLQDTTISPLPSHAGLNIQNGGLSPRLSARNSRLPSGTSSPVVYSGMATDFETPAKRADSPSPRDGPLIVDGSINSPKRRQPAVRNAAGNSDNFTISTSASEDIGIETPSTSEDHFHDFADSTSALHASISNDDSFDDLLHGQYKTPPLVQQQEFGKSTNGNQVSDAHPTVRTVRHDITSPQQVDYGTTAEGSSRPMLQKEQPATKKTSKQALTNGGTAQTNPASSLQPGGPAPGWQLSKGSKRKSRKANKSESDIAGLNSVGGEILPLNENLRKGG